MPAPHMLDAYLDRIGWGGDTTPALDTLAGLLRAHMQSIPFENLDLLLGRPIRLDTDSLVAKLVHASRGGYCFEHTTLFAEMLEQLGFRPVRHSARVVILFPRTQAPRTHMFITVALPEGTFIVDPGFGGPSAPHPVPLVDAGPDGPSDASHWMTRDDGCWVLRSRLGGKPSDAWVSTLEHDHPVDFEMANHFTATHPRSPFVNRLMMSVLTPDGRVTVMNRDVTVRHGDSATTTQLPDRIALRALLLDRFGIDLPEAETLPVPMIPEWT